MKAILSIATVVSLFSMASVATAQSPIVDVALTQDNLLRGQLVMSGGQAKSGANILVSSGQGVAYGTTTDDRGLFAVRVERGGMYILKHGETSVVIRAWTNQAAPPSAKTGILMVADEHVSRGNLSSRGARLSTRRYGPIESAVLIGAIGGVVFLAADNDAS